MEPTPTRTRTVTPAPGVPLLAQLGLQPVADPKSGIPIEGRPANYETGREDGRSEAENAAEIADETPHKIQPTFYDSTYNSDVEELRFKENMRIWKETVLVALRRHSTEGAIEVADEVTQAFDVRCQSGWFDLQAPGTEEGEGE